MTNESKPWVEKYRPETFNEIKGQNLAIEKLKTFTKYFNTQRKKALILHGEPGVGKTTLVHALAKEEGAEIFELNASDLRNKAKLLEVLKPVLEQRSLTRTKKIILVDEVDGISTVDRGGLPALISLMAMTPYPVIITANDIWKRKLSSLRQKCELVQLKAIEYSVILDILINILKKEELFVNQNILKSIAIRAKGDLRAAINDTQTVARTKDPSLLSLDERNKEEDIFVTLQKIFKQEPSNEILKAFDSINMPFDEITLWIEENIPKEYQGVALARAINLLAKADLFKGRIYKQQYWRFMVYQNIFLSYGISSAKKTINSKFTNYQKPTRILKIWMNNQRIAKKKSIAKKYASFVHVGEKRALQEFPILKQILKNPAIQEELSLDKEEIAYLNN